MLSRGNAGLQKIDADLSQADHANSVSVNLELPAAAQRALAEAAARRAAACPVRPVEIDGRPGPDPVRYGDWEVKGLASDF